MLAANAPRGLKTDRTGTCHIPNLQHAVSIHSVKTIFVDDLCNPDLPSAVLRLPLTFVSRFGRTPRKVPNIGGYSAIVIIGCSNGLSLDAVVPRVRFCTRACMPTDRSCLLVRAMHDGHKFERESHTIYRQLCRIYFWYPDLPFFSLPSAPLFFS